MGIDVLILNTAVVDFRSRDFAFTAQLAGAGGLAKCDTEDMPDIAQEQYLRYIKAGQATAGGPGNTAPLIAKAGLKVAVGVNLGQGQYEGLDAQGRFFYDMMIDNHVDMSATYIHPDLPTGTTYIYEKENDDRGGIAYFPNANDDFDFDYFKNIVVQLQPKIVYYMYSGLSKRGDAHDGEDLARFIRECREQGCVTIVDSHTLCGNPSEVIQSGQQVKEYFLLKPLLSELDIFFTSFDEAQMIKNTLLPDSINHIDDENHPQKQFLKNISGSFWQEKNRTQVFGVTVSDGAYWISQQQNRIGGPEKVNSRFMAGEVIDLVGAGDSFRAGLISYVARHINAFQTGDIDVNEAIQMGNLFASLYIKSPLRHRYEHIGSFEGMTQLIQSEKNFKDLKEISTFLNAV